MVLSRGSRAASSDCCLELTVGIVILKRYEPPGETGHVLELLFAKPRTTYDQELVL